MPVIHGSSPHDELLDEATRYLKPKSESSFTPARRECEIIAEDFRKTIQDAINLPGIADARNCINKLATDAENLAKQFRTMACEGVVNYGAATYNPADTTETDDEKRKEIERLKKVALEDADVLDGIAARWLERHDQWAGKETGQLNIYNMIFRAPNKQLAINATQLFARYRPPAVLHAGRKGDLYLFVELLFEAGAGYETKGDELLRPVREAVKAIRESQ